MTTPPKFTITNESVSIVIDGAPHVVRKGQPNFLPLRTALLDEKWDEVPNHLTIKRSIEEWAKGDFKIDGNRISFKGQELPNKLNERIVTMVTNGEDPEGLFAFWERLQRNPSYRSVSQLFDFLKNKGIPIQKDGTFLGYKSVRRDYTDHHSGEFDNSPGVTNKMERNKVSDDPSVECHEGFHIGSLDYASTFGDGGRRIVVCQVDPENVVSVPSSSGAQKMRVCEYKVIGNHGDQLPSTTFENDKVDNDDGDVEEIEPTEGGGDDDDLPVVTGQPEAVGGKATSAAVPALAKIEDGTEKQGKKSRKKHKFDDYAIDKLLEQPIDELRKYAGKNLEIIGASKIPGGKSALISRIIDVRGE